MTLSPTIGFPRMKTEAGEKRVFLPGFIEFLTRCSCIHRREFAAHGRATQWMIIFLEVLMFIFAIANKPFKKTM